MNRTTQQRLTLAVTVTFGFALIEALGGWFAGSLALLADASHMVTDGAALALALFAAWLANRPASPRFSYGWGRAELLTALINAASMLVIVAGIVWEAWQRWRNPTPIDGPLVVGVAVIGLAVNGLVVWLLGGHAHSHAHSHDHDHDHDHGHDLSHAPGHQHKPEPARKTDHEPEHSAALGEANLNLKGALLHVIGDLLGSVAAILSGIVVWATGWTPIDPLLSLLIAALVAHASLRLLKEALTRLLDGVPPTVALTTLGQSLAETPNVREIHDLHVWSLSGERFALTAHVTVETLTAWPETLAQLEAKARSAGIHHTTFQPERDPCAADATRNTCVTQSYRTETAQK